MRMMRMMRDGGLIMESSVGATRKVGKERRRGRRPVAAAFVSLVLAGTGCNSAATASSASEIKVNQVGFAPASQKLAVVPSTGADRFEVRTGDGRVVFSGELTAPVYWPFSDEHIGIADFSPLRSLGRYVVAVDGVDDSPPFEIRPDVHRPVIAAALKAFYFARSRIDLEAAYAGRWARPGGHPDDQVRVHVSASSPLRPEGTIIASPGGWYDAGDYNKYIVNASFATATLLTAYEHYSEYFDRFGGAVPESANEVPDIIDEAVFNLRWMLTMQDPDDGGVYHKLTTRDFEGMVMPAAAAGERFVVQKSTPAALDLAATAAIAARILPSWPDLEPFADDCLAAAEHAWAWAEANPGTPYVQPSDIHTGTYAIDGDDFADERAWAAVELFVTTGEARYLDGIELDQLAGGVPSWPWVAPFAWASLAFHDARPPGMTSETIVGRIVETAGLLRDQAVSSGYRVALGASPSRFKAHHPKRDFSWGSNGVAACQSMVLLWAYRLTGDASFRDAALSGLDYVLGRNATGYCFVTGLGHRSPHHPHHRPSQADGVVDPVPGFMVGGPHDGGEDPPACLMLFPSQLPALAYLDNVCSYATNEVAINWNAALVYAAAGLDVALAGERTRSGSGRVTP